ncbi:MAG: hypothetical protein J6Q54_03270 [Oscillospiraceae bacterium]|nr:hypothetical protein [Oscillospiraceae bacterium]
MDNKSRYKTMELILLIVLLIDLAFFIVFLVGAGNGITWMKVLFAILTIVISSLCLFFLYKTGELLKQRSLWMTTASAAILVCLLFSLILNFPSPSPFKANEVQTSVSTEDVGM